MDRKELEIMAPAGNFECLVAAIEGGANSVYFGIGNLNMRSRSANNFRREDLPEITRICREYGVKSYMTLNITLYGSDLAPAREVLDAAKSAGVGYFRKSPGVTMLTLASVHWALRIVATSSSQASSCVRAQRRSVPYSRSRASRICPRRSSRFLRDSLILIPS